jgi:hypothetical protein
MRWLMDGSLHETVLYHPCMPEDTSVAELPPAVPLPSQPLLPLMLTPVMDALSEKKPATNRLPTLHVVYCTSPTPAEESTPEQDCVYVRP